MLMSMMSAPAASAIRAPSAIQSASQPASCTTCGPTPVASQRNRDIGRPLTRSLLAVISETTSPAPSVAHRRRNGASVTPDIGARKTELETVIPPIFKGLRHDDGEPVTGVSFFRLPHHCDGYCTFCAQTLGSQASCLHFRQFYQMCKCTAAKTSFPTAIGNRSVFRPLA
jgi:hypothetical protein